MLVTINEAHPAVGARRLAILYQPVPILSSSITALQSRQNRVASFGIVLKRFHSTVSEAATGSAVAAAVTCSCRPMAPRAASIMSSRDRC